MKFLNKIADLFSHLPVILQIPAFALLALPFFGIGAGIRALLLNAGWDETNLLTTALFSLPALILFFGFIVLLSKAHWNVGNEAAKRELKDKE